MNDDDLIERIVKLEVTNEHLVKTNEEILLKLDEISAEMVRYKGFLGGIAFLASGIWVLVVMFKDSLLKVFH